MTKRLCTKRDPWHPSEGGFVEHTNVKEVGDGDEVARYICTNCGHSWKSERSQ